MSVSTFNSLEVADDRPLARLEIIAPAIELTQARPRYADWLAKIADYIELTKPRISILVLATVVVAMYAAAAAPPSPWLVLHTLLGTALVAGSASALNQRIERKSDAAMDRTADRPLPAGRLSDGEALVFSGFTIAVGLAYLTLAVNGWAAAIGGLTWLLYVAVYTPLKRVTPLNTVVGAVAGALPTLIGWAAVGGSFAWNTTSGLMAGTLFLIVYLWQFPHFMAIAWIYRRQYAAAGLKMLTAVDPSGCRAGMQAVIAALALLPVSLAPITQHAGPGYLVAAGLLGLAYFVFSCLFCLRRDDSSARWLLRASLVYLPSLLVMFVLVPLH